MNKNNLSNTVNAIADDLIKSQDKPVQKKLVNTKVQFSRSLSLDLGVRKGDAYNLISISYGTLQLISSINHVLFCSISGPETGGRPLFHASECYKSSIGIALKYLNPNDGNIDLSVRVPEDHPYNQAIERIFNAQIASLISHECSHVLLNHLTTPINILGFYMGALHVDAGDIEKILNQEREADSLSVQLLNRYLRHKATSPFDDVLIVAPFLLFQWLRLCERLYYSLFINNYRDDNYFTSDDITDNEVVIFSSLHGHPLAAERAYNYFQAIKSECIPQFGLDLCCQCENIVNYFMWIADDVERHRRVWKGEDPT